jgi:hypothetical protein
MVKSFGLSSSLRRLLDPDKDRKRIFDADVGTSRLTRLSIDLQPFRPTFPGAPGIVLEWPSTKGLAIPEDKAYTVFSEVEVEVEAETDGRKEKKTQRNRFRYCGEYQIEESIQADLGKFMPNEVR